MKEGITLLTARGLTLAAVTRSLHFSANQQTEGNQRRIIDLLEGEESSYFKLGAQDCPRTIVCTSS